jgi:uncharacterized membrane protein
MITSLVKKIWVLMIEYSRESWGTPFIVVFIVLLATAAITLSAGLSAISEGIVVFAYFALVLGVLGQFFCYLRYNKVSGER